ncbi:MAG: DUF2807 domain-containing protein [Winogradskyella sp.]|uniref:head GIN domain-containing protein n=1 Tax=Winogradskyella sp. TaxID=1883156 RepID=UPI001856380D|nr:DUF2807 domain-containing protein [Winogradskyella sp.]
MKKLIFLLSMLLSSVLYAQNSREHTVGEFSTVKVYDLINLTMIKSNENKVSITGSNRNDVVITNKNGTLKIRMNLEESFDGNNTRVILYYTSVDVIDANEGANVIVNDSLDQYEIDLKVQEGAEITATIKSTYANFRAVTGGIINVNGNSKNQDIAIYTGGIFNGKTFVTERSEVSVNAAGEAHINATELVEASVKVGGNIYIYGNPNTINESRVLGGTIKRM